jgi:hypothetical protein
MRAVDSLPSFLVANAQQDPTIPDGWSDTLTLGLLPACPSTAQNRWQAFMGLPSCANAGEQWLTWKDGFLLPRAYCSFAYSAFACVRMGISRSASFQRVRKSW